MSSNRGHLPSLRVCLPSLESKVQTLMAKSCSLGNGDSSDNQEDSNTAGVFRDRAATPPGRAPSDVLTPVSSRIVGLRQLHVNDSTDGGVVTGESIGMDLEGEVKVTKI